MSLRISHLRLLDLIVQSRRPQPQGAAVRSSRRTAGTNRMERSLPSPAPRATPRPRSATGCGDVRVGVRTNAYPGICRTEMNQESRNALADQSPTLVPSSYHPEAGDGVKKNRPPYDRGVGDTEQAVSFHARCLGVSGIPCGRNRPEGIANWRMRIPNGRGPRPKKSEGVGNKPNRVNLLIINGIHQKWERQTQG